jgi:hypothetical protein
VNWELRIIETGPRVGYAEDRENWPGYPAGTDPTDFRVATIAERAEA